MSNKNKTIALASLIAAGAGVAAVAASNSHKQAKAKKIAEKQQAESGTPYRNTERGKYEKNSKGIYYTNGNYEVPFPVRSLNAVENSTTSFSSP